MKKELVGMTCSDSVLFIFPLRRRGTSQVEPEATDCGRANQLSGFDEPGRGDFRKRASSRREGGRH